MQFMNSSGTLPFQSIEFVLMDRDGVINRKAPESEYIYRWDSFDLLPNAEAAIATLNRSGRRVIVVTNQRGVSLGLYTLDQVAKLHARLQQHLAAIGAHIDAFYVCPHGKDECDCRKPKTGLLKQAFHDFTTATTQNSLLIGDSLCDMQLAHNFGIPSIMIRTDDQCQVRSIVEAAALASATSSSLWEAISTLDVSTVNHKQSNS
jgi:D-glycero-D-manno-heptose 1,7-bisphosphate phosphatase